MRILHHLPHPTIYAGRTIANGYRNAAISLGHDFRFLTADDSIGELLESYRPAIFFTSLNPYYLKYLDLELIKKYKNNGLRVYVNIPFWSSPLSKTRINETTSLKNNKEYIDLITSGSYGDVFYNSCEQEDERMVGFTQTTGLDYQTLPLAADHTVIFPEVADKFKADISFIGTYLPEKRQFFNEVILPKRSEYIIKLYGQDWTIKDRILGMAQKGGQYFNIPVLKGIQKPKLALEDERRVYSSSLISINVHEEYQKKFGGDCNERTFKVPLAGGFEITDDVACIKKYFKENEEIIIASSKKDWQEKLDYYIRNPEERLPIIEAGKKRVLAEHTYAHRLKKLVDLCAYL